MSVSYRHLHFVIVMAAMTVLGAVQAKAMHRYDAVDDFNVRSNPNGRWSYRDSGLLTEHLHVFHGIKDLESWSNDFHGRHGAVLIVRNKTGNTVTIDNGDVVIPPDHLLLSGNESESGAVVGFRVPVAGIYKIRGDFIGLNLHEHEHEGYISVNSVVTYFTGVRGYNRPHHFRLSLTLATGDFLNFTSQRGVNGSEETGLKVKIVGP